jgi:UTP-glucose-1-phosphate uridylyltransferase
MFDCGNNAEYILANLEFALKDPVMKTKIKNYLKTR